MLPNSCGFLSYKRWWVVSMVMDVKGKIIREPLIASSISSVSRFSTFTCLSAPTNTSYFEFWVFFYHYTLMIIPIVTRQNVSHTKALRRISFMANNYIYIYIWSIDISSEGLSTHLITRFRSPVWESYEYYDCLTVVAFVETRT